MIRILLNVLQTVLTTKSDLVLENLSLRKQVAVLKGNRPRPKLVDDERKFWVALCKAWPR